MPAGLYRHPARLVAGQTGLKKRCWSALVLLILIVELLNSAIEAVVDRVIRRTPRTLQAGLGDIGSAAVMLTLILTAATWGLILVPHYLFKPELHPIGNHAH